MTDKQQLPPSAPLDATGEFFSVGAPLHAVRPGYVRRRADDELFDTLMSGGYAHVIAPDRSGKSSLVAATSARLQSNGIKVAVIDLAQISERDGGADAGRWYYNIAYRLLRQLRLKTDLQAWWQDKSMVSNRQRLVEFYVEVILKNIQDHIVIFVDEIQLIEGLTFEEHLLASIRAAHNSRVTDPEFSRLSFVLLGECDPHSLVTHDGLSPFAVSRKITLPDFSREELDIFMAELALAPADASDALDRIFYWTNGQPYLTQKLARSIAREAVAGDIGGHVDRIALNQLAGRAALHSEPHMSHIHRTLTSDRKHSESLLNIYGRMRKGISVIYDPDSPHHRRLVALGLVVADSEGCLTPRNRVYEKVFTAKWANENLPIHWRGPAIAAAVVIAIVAVPFWYTQVLPRSHLELLSTTDAELSVVADAYENLRTFPGHRQSADNLYRNNLRMRAQSATNRNDIDRVESYAARMPDGESFGEQMVSEYWDRSVLSALKVEKRDQGLIAALESLIVPTPERRQQAANLIGDDYPYLIGTIPPQTSERVLYDPENNLVSFVVGPSVAQWSMSDSALQERATWTLTALEVTPLVRRLPVEQAGSVRSVSLSINLAHTRKDDLRVKLIAPSGRTVELGFDESIAKDDAVVFPGSDLDDLIGEAIAGTWSLSVRDESIAVPGSLSSWSLTLNGRSHVDAPERGVEIPDPVARESNDIWFSSGGRFAVARAMHSDSARLWDLLYAQPARTIAVPASERVLGLSGGAEYLVSAGQDTISLWRTSTGRRHSRLEVNVAGAELELSEDGHFLSVLRRGDAESEFEIWSIDAMRRLARLTIAGSPALISVSADGRRMAVADYDRAVRIWDLNDSMQLVQIDLANQPSEIRLSASGDSLGVLQGSQGLSVWNVNTAYTPVFRERGEGDWQLAFSPSGSRVIAGNSRNGFQVRRTDDGTITGPRIGTELEPGFDKLLAFSSDENSMLTAGRSGIARFWRAPSLQPAADARSGSVWNSFGDAVYAVANGGQLLAIGDEGGHVHILGTEADRGDLAESTDHISFLGHQHPVASLAFGPDGSTVASIDNFGVVRVWDAASGLPRSFKAATSAAAGASLAFSPDGGRLAVLAGPRLWIIDTSSGELAADIDLGEHHSDLAFAAESQIYLGSETGKLRSVAADRTGSWNSREIWSGDAPLTKIAHSRKRDKLIIVDTNHRVSALDLRAGTISSSVLQLPDAVRDIVFSPSETRVLLRTARWIHRARISPSGLSWADALRSPKAMSGSSLVLDMDSDGSIDPLAHRLVILTRDTGFAEVAELNFGATDKAALIGSKDDLLAEWRMRLAVDQPDSAPR